MALTRAVELAGVLGPLEVRAQALVLALALALVLAGTLAAAAARQPGEPCWAPMGTGGK